MRVIYAFIFKLLGWSVRGHFPRELKKYIIAVAPHTSNWDFLVGIAARSILRISNTQFLAKTPLFRPPHGWIFRALGGHPVERGSKQDMVRQVVALFNSHDQFILAIAPEGTRKKVEKLRSGFYYIAKGANVPIIPVGFDFNSKEVVIGTPLYPGENMEADFDAILTFYRKIRGKNPALGFDPAA